MKIIINGKKEINLPLEEYELKKGEKIFKREGKWYIKRKYIRNNKTTYFTHELLVEGVAK
jgi:hypothetical protein